MRTKGAERGRRGKEEAEQLLLHEAGVPSVGCSRCRGDGRCFHGESPVRGIASDCFHGPGNGNGSVIFRGGMGGWLKTGSGTLTN